MKIEFVINGQYHLVEHGLQVQHDVKKDTISILFTKEPVPKSIDVPIDALITHIPATAIDELYITTKKGTPRAQTQLDLTDTTLLSSPGLDKLEDDEY